METCNLILLWFMLDVSSTTVHVDIQLVEFYNPSGTTEDGKLCDTLVALPFDAPDCDHVLYICLGDTQSIHPHQSYDALSCPYYHGTTRDYKNTNDITFDSNIGPSITNPMQVNLHNWTDTVTLLVKVCDVDFLNADDTVDHMSYNLQGTPQSYSDRVWSDNVRVYGKRSSEPTSLVIQYRVYYDENHDDQLHTHVTSVPVVSSISNDSSTLPSQIPTSSSLVGVTSSHSAVFSTEAQSAAPPSAIKDDMMTNATIGISPNSGPQKGTNSTVVVVCTTLVGVACILICLMILLYARLKYGRSSNNHDRNLMNNEEHMDGPEYYNIDSRS